MYAFGATVYIPFEHGVLQLADAIGEPAVLVEGSPTPQAAPPPGYTTPHATPPPRLPHCVELQFSISLKVSGRGEWGGGGGGGDERKKSNSGRREADVNSPVHFRSRPQNRGFEAIKYSTEMVMLACYESTQHHCTFR